MDPVKRGGGKSEIVNEDFDDNPGLTLITLVAAGFGLTFALAGLLIMIYIGIYLPLQSMLHQ